MKLCLKGVFEVTKRLVERITCAIDTRRFAKLGSVLSVAAVFVQWMTNKYQDLTSYLVLEGMDLKG